MVVLHCVFLVSLLYEEAVWFIIVQDSLKAKATRKDEVRRLYLDDENAGSVTHVRSILMALSFLESVGHPIQNTTIQRCNNIEEVEGALSGIGG